MFFDNKVLDWITETIELPIVLHKESIQISRDLLQRKYFEAFNFYFSKPINEIIANLSLPHVILYKDFLYYDDDGEYLKRSYRLDEVIPRIENLSKFYNNTAEGLTRPNLAVHEQNKIILKRNNKLHKYYLNKLENFGDIPQTQRHPKVKEDFKILNNLHDDDGFSSDLYSHAERRNLKNEDQYNKVLDNDDDQIHNSFQQMLEKYENATAKLSFESQEHNVYEPEYSTESQNVNKSTEDNISFDKSLENYAKNHTDDFYIFEKQIFSDSKSLERASEKARNENEDQIPHNTSDFAFSDVSEINLINEIIRGSRDEDKFANNIVKEALKYGGERSRIRGKPKEAEELEKQKQKIIVPHKVVGVKSKSTSGKHIPNKQSDSFNKRSKISLDKVRISKDFDSNTQHDTIHEKPLKSSERNINRDHYLDKGAGNEFTSARRIKEEAFTEKSATSGRNTEFYDKMSPREMQYPIISIKNIQINQIKSIDMNKEHHDRGQVTKYDDKNFSGKNRKSTPQAKKKGSGSFKKLSIPGDSKTTAEKSGTSSSSSIQYIKGLMEKYQKYSDDIQSSKSKGVYEKFIDTNMAKNYKDIQDDNTEKTPRTGEIYASSDLYTRLAKKTDSKGHVLGRSKTEDALVKEISQNRSKKTSKESPTKVFENQPNSSRRVVVSPSNPRKDKLVHRFGSNEGISPRLIASTTNKLTTHLSSENSKVMGDNISDDRLLTVSSNLKSVKVEKVFSYKRSEMKPPMKTNPPKNEISNSTSSNTRRLTAAHTYSGASSIERNDLVISMPVSPTKRFDLKLNLNRLNQAPGKYPNDTNTENSYGFWTSRSAKLGPDEDFRHLKLGGATDDRHKHDSSKKEYLLKKNYEPYIDSKKKGKTNKKVESFTSQQVNNGLKSRENESIKHATHFKSAAHEIDLNQIYIHDLNEVSSAGRIPTSMRGSEARLDSYNAKNDIRRPSKK